MRGTFSILCLALGTAVIIVSCGGGNNKESGFAGNDGGGSGSGSSSSSGGGSGSSSSSGSFGGDGEAAEGGGQTSDPTTCSEATSSHSYIGCDYWPTVTANVVWSIFDFAVVVANGGTNMANITITGPGTTGNQTGTVAPGQLTKFYLPWVTVLKGQDADNCGEAVPFASSVLAHGAAYHLVSSVPVTVYQFNALEYQGMGGPSGKSWASCPGSQVCAESGAPSGCFSFSNDASLLLPSTAMTGNYRVTGHGGWGGTAMIPAYMAITAINANTTVNVTVSSTGSIAAGGGIPATAANGTLTLTLGAGDVAELVGGATDASDLSGSLIKASGPVQVITGLPCLNVPDDAPACDHVEESNLPAETLGTDYVVAQPVAPTGKTVGHNVRIYGNFANTTLTYLPSAPPGCPTTINQGEVVDCGVALGSICEDDEGIYDAACGPQLITEQDFEIKGSQAFAVGSYSLGGSLVDAKAGDGSQQGDPDQSMAIATAQYRQSYVFLAPSDYEDSWAVIIAPTGTSVTLDGLPVSTAPTPIASTSYGVIRVQLGAGQNGAHVLTASNPVGLQVMGYGAYTSYTYPGGLDLKFISPPPSQ